MAALSEYRPRTCPCCRQDTLRWVGHVEYGWFARCPHCGHETRDENYPAESICDSCYALYSGADGPDTPTECAECAPELWAKEADAIA